VLAVNISFATAATAPVPFFVVKRLYLAAAIMVAGVTASACSSSSPLSSTPTKAPPSSTTTSPDESVQDPGYPVSSCLTLLFPTEMPGTWLILEQSLTGDSTSSYGCAGLKLMRKLPSRADETLQTLDHRTYFYELVAAGPIRQVQAAFTSVATTCAKSATQDINGVAASFSPLHLPATIGDQSAAWEFTGRVSGRTITFYFAASRVDNILIYVSEVGTNSNFTDVTDALKAAAAEQP
jgi:hypothetical protein